MIFPPNKIGYKTELSKWLFMHFSPYLSVQKVATLHTRLTKTEITMAFKQNVSRVSISLLIIMVITAPFVHSSRKLHFLLKIFLLKPKKKRRLFSPSFNNLSMSAGSYGGIEPARDTSMPTKVMNQN